MRRRFFWAIFGVAAAVLVALTVTLVVVANLSRAQATRREMARVAAVAAEQIRTRLTDREVLAQIRAGDTTLATELDSLRRAAGSTELQIFLVAPDGGIIGRPGLGDLGLDTGRLLSGENVFLQIPREGRTHQVLVVPVGEIGRRGAVVALALTRAYQTEAIPTRLLAVVLGVVAVLAAFAARILSRSLERRLQPLAEAARAVSAGDLTARAEPEGDDELAALADAFNEMAERLGEARAREREFLLSVGHDLRTPLTTIGGYAEALAEGIDDPDEVRRIASVLDTQSRRLRRLIEDVMLLARLESAEFTLRPEPVDLSAHLAEVVAGFEPRARAARVDLVARFEAVGLRLIDPDRVAQLVGNLVENALRYTPEAGTVTVELVGLPSEVTIRVGDTGAGIDPEDLPHVFERFYVARRYREARPEGSGLGLSIVARLVEAMGGRVGVDSRPGEGTTVTVEIPAPPVRAARNSG